MRYSAERRTDLVPSSAVVRVVRVVRVVVMFNREGSLRDRIFGGASSPASSDPVIQQMRDDLDKQRQMFFDRVGHTAPHWDAPPSSIRVNTFVFDANLGLNQH